MKSQIDKLMQALQKMPENNLTNNVIIPLLKELGYKSVEFYGGTNEEGKDIVCWEESKFGENKLVVAQVKHFKFTNKASDSSSFQTIVNQLTMCFEKKLVFTDQMGYSPSIALLISSYQLDVKTLQTRLSENSSLRTKGIEIIDGVKLATFVFKKLPSIAEGILGTEIDFSAYYKSSLNNKTVLKALGFHDNIILKNIYTDIDFSLGKTTTKLFFNSKFDGVKESYEIGNDDWVILKRVLKETKMQIGNSYIDKSIEDIEFGYEEDIIALKRWETELKELKNKTNIQREQNTELKRKLTPLLRNRDKISIEKNKLLAMSEMNTAKSNRLKEIEKFLKETDTEIELIENSDKKLSDLIEEVEAKEESKPSPKYRFKIDGTILSSIIKSQRDKIVGKVNLFNKKHPNKSELTTFIEECKFIIDSSNTILSNPLLAKNLLGSSANISLRDNLDKTRFKLPIDEIFDTNHNTILLGEAGAGKTTCLQMYALSKIDDSDKLIFWAPLSHLLQKWSLNNSLDKKDTTVNFNKKIKEFDTAIHQYLQSKNINIEFEEFVRNLNGKNTVLLLDGLDEAIKHNPWLPKAVKELSKKYNNVQIIITSRSSGSYIDEIPFFTVTLLPFTAKQRNEFIKKWFGEGGEDTVKKIIRHLSKNKAISDVIKNPLLATTLCVLARHNLPLPQTEIKLYNDRLKLLTGYYDNVKNIDTRITTVPQNLELLAQKLAFYLHRKGVRALTIEELENESINILRSHLDAENSKIALNELIDPCNILVPMTDDGQYGFGHLRYQEHLAAVELQSNRSIDIEILLTNQWWQDTLILFAQMSESIEWLISKVNFQIEISEIRKVIFLMLETRPGEEQKRIRKQISKIKDERKELNYISPDDFL